MSRAAQGLRAWLLQRFTAVYLAVYLISSFSFIGFHGSFTYSEWHSWLGLPWSGVTTVLFALALSFHVWVGIRDVLIDYVHAIWLRLLLLSLTALVLLFSLLWVVRALTLAAFGESG